MGITFTQVERRLIFWYAEHEQTCRRSKEKACPVCGRKKEKVKPRQKEKAK